MRKVTHLYIFHHEDSTKKVVLSRVLIFFILISIVYLSAWKLNVKLTYSMNWMEHMMLFDLCICASFTLQKFSLSAVYTLDQDIHMDGEWLNLQLERITETGRLDKKQVFRQNVATDWRFSLIIIDNHIACWILASPKYKKNMRVTRLMGTNKPFQQRTVTIQHRCCVFGTKWQIFYQALHQ